MKIKIVGESPKVNGHNYSGGLLASHYVSVFINDQDESKYVKKIELTVEEGHVVRGVVDFLLEDLDVELDDEQKAVNNNFQVLGE